MPSSRSPESHLKTPERLNTVTSPDRLTRSTEKLRIVGVAIWLNVGPTVNGQPFSLNRPKAVVMAIKVTPVQIKACGVRPQPNTLLPFPVRTSSEDKSSYFLEGLAAGNIRRANTGLDAKKRKG